MEQHSIGIDLGTSTSIVSVIRDGKPFSIPDPRTKTPIVPSIIGLNRRGEFVTGQDAIDAVKSSKSLIRESKRGMGTDTQFALGDKQLRPEEAGALILKKMKEVAESYLGSPVDSAVITVPAYFTDLERRATLTAAELARIKVIRLISEPVAAAAAFGINNLDIEERVLVFDMGGGTLDVTVLEMIDGILDVKASHGDKFLGGKDIDQLLIDYAKSAFGKEHPTAQWDENADEALKREAERVKKALSDRYEEDFFIANIATDSGEQVNMDLAVSRSQLEVLVKPLLDRAVEVIETCLQKAQVDKSAIGKVLLVGGSTYVPCVAETVLRHIGAPKAGGVDPDLAVSQGAAISAALHYGQLNSESSIVIQDCATHSMGVLVIRDMGMQEVLAYDELIRQGTPIPYFRKEMYSLRRPDQTELEIEVVQDPSGKALLAHETVPTGAMSVIHGIPHAQYGTPHAVEVEFSYDQNHVIQMTATVVGVGKSSTIRLDMRGGLLGEEAMEDAFMRVDSLWETSPLAERHRSLIRRAEEALKNRPSNAELVEAALVELKAAISRKDADAAQEARDKLVEYLSDLP